MRLLLLCLVLSGCAVQVPRHYVLADGTQVDCLYDEVRTSLMNTQTAAFCTAPTKPLSVATVGSGVSIGHAILSTVDSGAVLGAGALIGTGTNQVNTTITPK